MKPIKIYGGFLGPNPLKTCFILSELDVPYEIEHLDFGQLKTPEYESINPNGRLPAIYDPNTDLTLWESGAIIFQPGQIEYYQGPTGLNNGNTRTLGRRTDEFFNSIVTINMARFYDFDSQKPFREQLEEETGPVVLTNTFTIPEGKVEEAIETWRKTAEILKFCPGYISTQLHRGVSSRILINVAVWDSAHHLRDGLNRENFKAVLASFPPGTECRAHLFRRQAVEGICIA
ncbi:uncharacterized protein CDV56_109607 [Aspergillus thermomutatus]|uniref:GST N-terminal domain-containing protein n=1 Tax=Aspergillus thermomutatus TaxID=41047 RepID=A0A397HVW7_ASPTH|nr:uncharacterized protein CDV56_109607 [Aspergillus thermomutatus]RHZ67381.1 hypothetical protein CDV56_109607 [Aspergillus thermomutatus]